MGISVKKRKSGAASVQEKPQTHGLEVQEDIDTIKKQLKYRSKRDTGSETKHKVASTSVTIMSFFTTFYKIWYPAQVVFDEVHFGKFAGYYLQRAFFFDVHPPLAKLMLAGVGYVIGFDGVYQFSNIGESYAANNVPYIALRALPASLNVFGVALIYNILKEAGFSVLTCFTTATLYLLDNAFIGQNRLILLDSILIFYMLATVYSYVKFRKYRHLPFTLSWWLWMVATGTSMALTLSVKMIGLFVVAAVGVAVVMDLWDLLDKQKYGLKDRDLARHFAARVVGLILVPAAVYLFWFYIHFTILKFSGPGDAYMSSRFQDTLTNSPLRINSLDIMYNQSIKLQHKETRAFLHSHALTYPAKYDDGRYSSQGIQVTGNMQPDINSYWRIKPAGPVDDALAPQKSVRHNDVVQLEHVGTGFDLLTHDVAAPWMPTNQEFTTTNVASRYNETLFRVQLDDHKKNPVWTTLMKSVKLIHVRTGVALWCNNRNLPDWGLNHLEINGNKKSAEERNFWVATDILGLNATEINLKKQETKVIKEMSFLSKFLELQTKMITHNNKLTGSHPYQSSPSVWPLMLRGISYWTKDDTKSQIYLTGNVAGWWSALACICLFSLTSVIDMAFRKRQVFLLAETSRIRLNRSGGFFLLLWATHYFPFYLMARSLYLHHYLPALACSYLLLGAVFEQLFIDGVNSPISYQPGDKKYTISQAHSTIKSYIAAFVLISMQFMVYLFLSPMTYGTPGMSTEEATRHKVLASWDIQYAKHF
ncbi:glycosyltransferase family 39 protein [Parasitella parasitica]|nr:glycosyltransferase family 39 protein [Parasitella parasitica]